jgi:hypothetical protein
MYYPSKVDDVIACELANLVVSYHLYDIKGIQLACHLGQK